MSLLPTQMYSNTKRNKSTHVVCSTIYTKIASMRKPLGKKCYTYTAAGKGKKKKKPETQLESLTGQVENPHYLKQ